jgi:hypothetical protein
MKKKEIKLIPLLDACDFSDELEEWCDKYDITTHYDSKLLYVNWIEDNDYCDYTIARKWLIENYGSNIMKYNTFAILPT